MLFVVSEGLRNIHTGRKLHNKKHGRMSLGLNEIVRLTANDVNYMSVIIGTKNTLQSIVCTFIQTRSKCFVEEVEFNVFQKS